MRILVPVDGSQHSRRALQFIREASELTGTRPEVELLSVQSFVSDGMARMFGAEAVKKAYTDEGLKVFEGMGEEIAARVACEGKLGKDQDVHGLVAGLFEERRHFRHIGGRIRHMYPEQGTADIDKAIGAVHVLQSFLVLVQEGLAVQGCRKQCRNNAEATRPDTMQKQCGRKLFDRTFCRQEPPARFFTQALLSQAA